MTTELHLPWDNNALENLLLQIMKTGEAAKIDFKRQLNITSSDHHAELLKDISALANSYDHHYQNHGFIILGVTENTLTYTKFDETTDRLQAKIDDLLNKYIEPFVQTQVRIFGTDEKTWGVIVVPPTRTAPHVFVKDIHKRCRGDIFVRKGTTTDKSQPSDYVRFFRLHLDEHTYELREQVGHLKRELATLKQNLLIAVERPNNPSPAQKEPERSSETSVSFDLLRAIDQAFERATDPIASGLFNEALKIRNFLVSGTVPWALNQITVEMGRQVFEEMEKCSTQFWTAVGKLALQDDKGQYDEAILRAISCLAQKQEAPTNVPYTDWSIYVRYYPLVVTLYILFVALVFRRRFSLLKKILALELTSRSYYEDALPLSNVLFFIRRASEVFQTRHPQFPSRWCDAISMVVEPIVQQTLNINETYSQRTVYLIGEFVLCLTPIDVIDRDTKVPSHRHPAPGAYLYFFESNMVIGKFLRAESKWLAKIFQRPLEEILKDFDTNAIRLISPGCAGHGFINGATSHAFPQSVKSHDASGKSE